MILQRVYEIVRIISRKTARELSLDELEQVAGSACPRATVATTHIAGTGIGSADTDYDCYFYFS